MSAIKFDKLSIEVYDIVIPVGGIIGLEAKWRYVGYSASSLHPTRREICLFKS